MPRRDLALEDQIVELAKGTVIAVVTARDANNCADAELVISAYLRDARKLGANASTAWALLFSACTLWVAALIEVYAAAHDETPAQSIAMFALAHANGEPGQ